MTQRPEITELLADVREHVLFLKELGVENFNASFADEPEAKTRTEQSSGPGAAAPANFDPPVKSVSVSPPMADVAAKPAAKPKRSSRINVLPSLAERKSHAKEQPPSPAESTLAQPITNLQEAPGQVLVDISAVLPATVETIEDIRLDIGNCTRCPLSQGRTQIVHTTGNMEAELMFIGEAPGADEDEQGVPFVGRAGKLLTQIIEAIGYSRDSVAIGNINRCRPPGNRQPTLPEAHTCRPFLMREIAVIKPKVIVVLGNTAMHNLLDTKVGITKMRGQFHDYFNVKVMPTFHPAYLLRDPHKKREVWEDMKMVRDYLAKNL